MIRVSKPLVVALSAALCACAPVAYKRPDGAMYGGHQGYRDKEIAPGTHVIEIQQIGGYQFIFKAEETKAVFLEHWKRRATELCPQGYSGSPDWIEPYDAQIEEFRCNLRFCQDYPMLSGIAKCDASG